MRTSFTPDFDKLASRNRDLTGKAPFYLHGIWKDGMPGGLRNLLDFAPSLAGIPDGTKYD